MSFVMDFATPVNVIAPKKFMNAAIIIACLGFNAFVETEVAMAFAVSWNPLMKSKASAQMTISMVRMSNVSMFN